MTCPRFTPVYSKRSDNRIYTRGALTASKLTQFIDASSKCRNVCLNLFIAETTGAKGIAELCIGESTEDVAHPSSVLYGDPSQNIADARSFGRENHFVAINLLDEYSTCKFFGIGLRRIVVEAIGREITEEGYFV